MFGMFYRIGFVCSIVVLQNWINFIRKKYFKSTEIFNSVLFYMQFYNKKKGMVEMDIDQKSILDYFNVNSQQELLDFMKENPDNRDVLLLKELIARLERDGGDSLE